MVASERRRWFKSYRSIYQQLYNLSCLEDIGCVIGCISITQSLLFIQQLIKPTFFQAQKLFRLIAWPTNQNPSWPQIQKQNYISKSILISVFVRQLTSAWCWTKQVMTAMSSFVWGIFHYHLIKSLFII